MEEERRAVKRRYSDEHIPWQDVWARFKWWFVFAGIMFAFIGSLGSIVIGTTTWFLKLDNRVHENAKNIGQVAGVLERTVDQLQICRENATKTAVILDTLIKGMDDIKAEVKEKHK
jgi:hypothetical protein